MVTVPATEFAKNFGRYRDIVQTEAVEVTSHDRVTGYFISRVEYEALQTLKARLPRALAAHELSEETLQALALSRMDARHDALNDLLED